MNEARNIAKMMQPTEQKIGRNTFYIYPLPAFTAANLSTEVVGLLSPLVGGISEAFKGSGTDSGKENKSLMDLDVSEAAPYIAEAFSSLSADKTERLLRNLLTNGHVVVRPEGSPDAEYLTEDKCNEIFCGNIQNMFVLAFYVMKVNYQDFFGSFGNPSGKVGEALKKIGFPNTEPLTPEGSAT